MRPYQARPVYDSLGGLQSGWEEICRDLPATSTTLALEGPMILPWDELVGELGTHLDAIGRVFSVTDMRVRYRPWAEVVDLTSTPLLRDDPHFEAVPAVRLGDLLDETCWTSASTRDALPDGAVTIVFGPGAALLPHDLLWYVELPKRYAERLTTLGEGRNVGQAGTDAPATIRRLLYIDWPLLDAHRDAISADIDKWVDLQDPATPRALTGPYLRDALRALLDRPFRTRPTFNSTPWGGTWGQKTLGMNLDEPNTALGYELIAPESGILLGSGADAVEVPLQLLIALHPTEVLGQHVHGMFGYSFPIRFDYLDTHGGGNLSVHCHPTTEYMRDVFGWPYTQHESYYMMRTEPGSVVYLGLRDDAEVEDFRQATDRAAHDAVALDATAFVNTLPAHQHQLYLIPGGTPHGSGEGNVVLEVSATPYLYSLRFYDWLRKDGRGAPRPLHLDHAFGNIRRAPLTQLTQSPRTVSQGDDWCEEVIGSLPDMFFDVRRLRLGAGRARVRRPLDDRFMVLTVVEGGGVLLRTEGGTHDLAYAETAIVPAAAAWVEFERLADEPVTIVFAVVV